MNLPRSSVESVPPDSFIYGSQSKKEVTQHRESLRGPISLYGVAAKRPHIPPQREVLVSVDIEAV